MDIQVNTIENDILYKKSKEYVDDRLAPDGYGLSGDFDEIRDAFSDGCLFTVDLAQKIVEDMFSSFTLGDTGRNLARDFRNKLFDNIKAKEISR